MKKHKLIYLIAVLMLGLGWSGTTAALDVPGDLPGAPPGFPSGSPPGYPDGSLPGSPPGFPPQCAGYAEAKSACHLAAVYCQAALEDWKDPQGLTSKNLKHCAYHSKKCNGILGGSEFTEFPPQTGR